MALSLSLGLTLGTGYGVAPTPLLADQQQRVPFQCVAEKYRPIIQSQAFDVDIVASKNSLTAPQLRVQVAQCSVTLGTTMRAFGAGPVVTLAAGSGSLTYAAACPGLKVEVDSVAGGTAVGQFTFRISYNSGSTWAHSGVTSAATYNIPDGPAVGNVVGFPAGTYSTSHSWEGAVATIRSSEGNAYTFTNATAAAQPVFRDAAVTPDGKDALFWQGAQQLLCTDAGVLALFTNDPALTVIGRIAYAVVDAISFWLAAGRADQNANSQRRYGNTSTGNGREHQLWQNDAGSSVTHICTTDPLTGSTNAHNVCWYGPGGNGGGKLIDVNGAAETANTSATDIGTMTPTRVSLGAECAGAAGSFQNGYTYDLAVFSSQLGSTDRGSWNTALAAGT